jgi:glycosyltransferase involved in cell wall biosynthesis
MHILLFEPNTQGHHLIILRYIAEDLLSAGHTLSLAFDNRSAARSKLELSLKDLLQLCQMVSLYRDDGQRRFSSKLSAAAGALVETGADLVFFPCFDEVSSSLCRRAAFGLMPPRVLRGRIRGLFIRPRIVDQREHGGFSLWLKKIGFNRFYRQGWADWLFVFDETLPTSLRAGFNPAAFPVLPDPWAGNFAHDKVTAREKLGLPQDRFVLLHYGTASRRKGLHLVAQAATSLDLNKDILLVCAGERGNEASEELQHLKNQDRLRLFNRHITDAEEELFFCAADAVALAYLGHYGSSGVLSRAAAAGRWVIASDEGLVGHRVRTNNLGLTFKTGDVAALRETLSQAIALASKEAAAFAPGLARFAARHSRESFRAALLAQFSATTQPRSHKL